MSDISQWSTAAASNNAAPPDGAPEGMVPSTVNDTMREIFAAVARQYQDTNGTLVSAGTGNNYTLTTNTGHAALADQGMIVFRADRSNTGATTLNVDALGAKNVEANGTALPSGYLAQDSLYVVCYNATNDTYDILNAALIVGTDVQAWDAALDDISALAVDDGNIIVGDGANWVAESGATARTSLGAAADTLSGVDFSGLTAIEGNALDATDNILVMDGATAKQMAVQDVGLRLNTGLTGAVNLNTTHMNAINEFVGTGTLTIQTNATTDLPVGTPVVLNVKHADQELTVTADTSVTLISIFHPAGATASDVVSPGGTALLYQTVNDSWVLTGDIAD